MNKSTKELANAIRKFLTNYCNYYEIEMYKDTFEFRWRFIKDVSEKLAEKLFVDIEYGKK